MKSQQKKISHLKFHRVKKIVKKTAKKTGTHVEDSLGRVDDVTGAVLHFFSNLKKKKSLNSNLYSYYSITVKKTVKKTATYLEDSLDWVDEGGQVTSAGLPPLQDAVTQVVFTAVEQGRDEGACG